MHVGPSISAAILVTAIGAVPHAESASLGAEDGSVDLFTQEAAEALVNDLPADIFDSSTNFTPLILQASSDETNIFDNLDSGSDDTLIASNIGSSCLGPASKREVLDEGSLFAESPASCKNDPVNAPLDLTLPSLDLGSFDLLLEGSQGKKPSSGSSEEQWRNQRPWWRPERLPYLNHDDHENECEQQVGVELVPVCCLTWPNMAGKALRCIYYDALKCMLIKYHLCCEFLNFIENPYGNEYRDAYGCPWDGGFAKGEPGMN